MYLSRDVADVLAAALRESGRLELAADGRSMYPLIRPGDACRFAPCDASELRKGDVALYYAETGRLVAHRLIGTVEPDGTVVPSAPAASPSSLSSATSAASFPPFSSPSPARERAYLFQGDANVSRDPPVRADAILGKLVWVRRDGALPLPADAFAIRLWRAALLTFPMLRLPLHRLARRARVSSGGAAGAPL